MKTVTFFIMLIICLSLSSNLCAEEEYILSGGDSIQVFIYKYHPAKTKLTIKKLKKLDIKDIDIKDKRVGLYLKKKGIAVKKAEEEERGGGIVIRPDGKATIPLIGEVVASGKTIGELDRIITESLKQYMPNPEVTVILTGMAYHKNKVYVQGEVESPGLYTVAGEMSVLKALAMAGFTTTNAALSGRIYLYRRTPNGRETIPLKAGGLIDILNLQDIRTYPGDIIYVPRSKLVTFNDFFSRYIKPLEFLVLLANLGDTGDLDVYFLTLGLVHGIKWVFFDEYPGLFTSSINIPLDSWIYQCLDELDCKGIFKEGLITTRPLTRNDVGLLVRGVENREALDNATPTDWCCMRRALERLEREFGKDDRNIYGYIRTGLFLSDNHDDSKYFDYQRDQNWFGDGLNPRTEFSLGGDIFPKLSYNFTGSLWYNGNKIKEDLKESYLKLNFKNLEIEIGRDHLWWGPGYHGSLLLSDNSPPFDLVKLTTRTERFKFTTFLTQLEKERFIPEPYLNGMRFEWSPFDNFTLGGSRMIMFMGEDRPSLRLKDIPTVLGGENVGGRLETNQLAGLDISLRFKNLKLYGNWAGEDQAKGFPSAEGYQLGGFFKEFFHKDLDFRIEYAINRKKPHQKATWYEHHLYQSGYSYKGRVIGHHMGGDSQDIFFRLGYRLNPKTTCAFEFDHERHGMIKPVEERDIKYALEVQYDLTPSSSIFLRNENWWTKNNDFVAGKNVRDGYVRLEWEYRF